MGAPFIFIIGAWAIMAAPFMLLEVIAKILLLPFGALYNLFNPPEEEQVQE